MAAVPELAEGFGLEGPFLIEAGLDDFEKVGFNLCGAEAD